MTCISVEPAGNRLVTGSLDYGAKLFDFGGMDRSVQTLMICICETCRSKQFNPVTDVSTYHSAVLFEACDIIICIFRGDFTAFMKKDSGRYHEHCHSAFCDVFHMYCNP